MKWLTISIVQAAAISAGLATGVTPQVLFPPDQAVRSMVPLTCGTEDVSGWHGAHDDATPADAPLGDMQTLLAGLADRLDIPAGEFDLPRGIASNGAQENPRAAASVCVLDLGPELGEPGVDHVANVLPLPKVVVKPDEGRAGSSTVDGALGDTCEASQDDAAYLQGGTVPSPNRP